MKPNSERNWVIAWAVAIVLVASIPYVWGLAFTPEGGSFLGFTHNIDDCAVYLSWMRQSADGHFFIRNLFTTEPQPALQFNMLFLVMGWLAALTRLPLALVFHVFRLGLGVVLIWAIWRLSKLFIEDANTRRLLIPLVGLSSGIGWLIPGAKPPVGSVDVWQPEAITFLSIYLNPLFLAGLILMVGAFYFLTLAQRTASARHAVCAGLCVLLLGNVHSYDVITVACVWTAYLVARAAAERRLPTRAIALSLLAAIVALPSIGYQFYVYHADPVFQSRVNTPIPSPPVLSFLTGFGLVLVGAIVGVVVSLRTARSGVRVPMLLIVVWAVVGLAAPYIPIAQQRKLIMGVHIPLCVLCAVGLSYLLARAPRAVARSLAVAFILLTTASNISFLSKDTLLLSVGDTATIYSAYLTDDSLGAMAWLRRHASAEEAAYAPPTFALFTPALAGKPVYYGHWSETPDYESKLKDWLRFRAPGTSEWERAQILAGTEATHVVGEGSCTLPPRAFTRRFLTLEFRHGDVAVLRVNKGKLDSSELFGGSD